MKKGNVSKRVTWVDTVPFPGNPIYEGRLRQMDRRHGGYQPDLRSVPILADNGNGAFPDFPEETLFVLDGNHRRELASRCKKLNDEFIAIVHRGLTYEEMHYLREGNNDRRTVKPAETFLHRAARNANGVERRIKDDVEGLGWHISYERAAHGLSCTNELTWIWRKNRGAMQRAIQTYEAVWGIKPSRSQARVIKGLGAFWLRYPHASFDRLTKSLNGVTVEVLYASGKNQYDGTVGIVTSVYDGIRYSLAALYNRQLRSGRLPL